MHCCLLPQGGSEGLLTPNGPAIAEGKGCVDPSSLPLLPHPAKKQVWDFVRVLLMDSLLNIPANKQGHPLELLLEVSSVVIRLFCSTLCWEWKDRRYPASGVVKKVLTVTKKCIQSAFSAVWDKAWITALGMHYILVDLYNLLSGTEFLPFKQGKKAFFFLLCIHEN